MVCAASVLEGMDLTDAFSVVGSILKMSRPLNHTGVSHKCELSDPFLKNRDLRGTATYTLKQDRVPPLIYRPTNHTMPRCAT